MDASLDKALHSLLKVLRYFYKQHSGTLECEKALRAHVAGYRISRDNKQETADNRKSRTTAATPNDKLTLSSRGHSSPQRCLLGEKSSDIQEATSINNGFSLPNRIQHSTSSPFDASNQCSETGMSYECHDIRNEDANMHSGIDAHKLGLPDGRFRKSNVSTSPQVLNNSSISGTSCQVCEGVRPTAAANRINPTPSDTSSGELRITDTVVGRGMTKAYKVADDKSHASTLQWSSNDLVKTSQDAVPTYGYAAGQTFLNVSDSPAGMRATITDMFELLANAEQALKSVRTKLTEVQHNLTHPEHYAETTAQQGGVHNPSADDSAKAKLNGGPRNLEATCAHYCNCRFDMSKSHGMDSNAAGRRYLSPAIYDESGSLAFALTRTAQLNKAKYHAYRSSRKKVKNVKVRHCARFYGKIIIARAPQFISPIFTHTTDRPWEARRIKAKENPPMADTMDGELENKENNTDASAAGIEAALNSNASTGKNSSVSRGPQLTSMDADAGAVADSIQSCDVIEPALPKEVSVPLDANTSQTTAKIEVNNIETQNAIEEATRANERMQAAIDATVASGQTWEGDFKHLYELRMIAEQQPSLLLPYPIISVICTILRKLCHTLRSALTVEALTTMRAVAKGLASLRKGDDVLIKYFIDGDEPGRYIINRGGPYANFDFGEILKECTEQRWSNEDGANQTDGSENTIPTIYCLPVMSEVGYNICYNLFLTTKVPDNVDLATAYLCYTCLPIALIKAGGTLKFIAELGYDTSKTMALAAPSLIYNTVFARYDYQEQVRVPSIISSLYLDIISIPGEIQKVSERLIAIVLTGLLDHRLATTRANGRKIADAFVEYYDSNPDLPPFSVAMEKCYTEYNDNKESKYVFTKYFAEKSKT